MHCLPALSSAEQRYIKAPSAAAYYRIRTTTAASRAGCPSPLPPPSLSGSRSSGNEAPRRLYYGFKLGEFRLRGEIVIYQAEDGLTKVECRFVDETVWLTQQQMAELFHTSRSNIVEHIGHIYEEGELDETSTCRKLQQVRMEGNRQVSRELPFYNLDMIISLGYRVKSLIATQFRRWATERLKEYMIKGFTLDDERLKNLGGGNYWRELLERIRDIRSSKKAMLPSGTGLVRNQCGL